MAVLHLVLAFVLAFIFRLPITASVIQPEFPQAETESQIRLSVDRGYRNVLIAIGESVSEDKNLIDRIQDIFSDFSSVLYSVTNEYDDFGVFLQEVQILIPDSWSDDPSYEASAGHSFSASDVRIDQSTFEGTNNINQPYTHKATACGSPGRYIRLTPEYITDDGAAKPYGDRSKNLVHEWAHFRWGVFDEYPLRGDDHFYAAGNGEFEATKCVAAIPGEMRTPDGNECTESPDGAPDQDCRFFDSPDASESYEGSLMYKQFLPEMRKFCDTPENTFWNPAVTHNAEAPNQQNKLCATRSIWEVLRSHSDFPDNVPNNAPPVNGLPQVNVAPTFRLLKRRVTRSPIIIVLDTSGSMNTNQRLHTLRQASYNLITRVLNDDQIFGIVSFAVRASVEISPSMVGTDRQALTQALPTTASGGTSIGAGVILAIEEINKAIQDAGTQIIVLTDGGENEAPLLSDVQPSQLAGITAHTIAIGQQADNVLEDLANRTSGRTFEHRDQSAALFNIFTRLAVQDDSGTIEILSEPFNLTNITRRFSLDSRSGGEMTILIGFPMGNLPNNYVTVITPNGDVINDTMDVFQSVLDFDLIQIDSKVIVGEWQIRVQTNTIVGQLGTMHVETTRLSTFETLPIEIDAEWALPSVEPSEIQTLQVTVNQGYTPISNAVVKVSVSVPNGPPLPFQVWDDGVGADVRPDDGVYSGFFTQFKGVGRYSMRVSVVGVDGITKLMQGSFVGQGPAAADPALIQETSPIEVNTGSFERSLEGNLFRCTGNECNGTTDMYAPYRISDLRGYTSVENVTAVLTFTAPGDDLLFGTASYYELHIAKNITHLLRQFNETEVLQYIPFEDITNETMPPYVISGNLSAPLPARSREIFYVKLPEEGGDFNYIFSVVAVDDEGLRSQPSNFATVTADVEIEEIVQFPLPIIAGTLIPLLFLLLLLFILLFVLKKRSKKGDDTESMVHKSDASETVSTAVVNNACTKKEGAQTDNGTVKHQVQITMASELTKRQQMTQRTTADTRGQAQFTTSEKHNSNVVANGGNYARDQPRQAYGFVGGTTHTDDNKNYADNVVSPSITRPEDVRNATKYNDQPYETNYPLVRGQTNKENTKIAEKVYYDPSVAVSIGAIDNPAFEKDDMTHMTQGLQDRPVPMPKGPPPRLPRQTRDDETHSLPAYKPALPTKINKPASQEDSDDDANDYEFVANPNSPSGQAMDMMNVGHQQVSENRAPSGLEKSLNFKDELSKAINHGISSGSNINAAVVGMPPLEARGNNNQQKPLNMPPIRPPKPAIRPRQTDTENLEDRPYDEAPKSGDLPQTADSDSDSDDYEPVVDPNSLTPMGLAYGSYD